MKLQPVQQNEPTAAHARLYFELVSSTDGVSAVTGATGTAKLSKNGGAAATSTNSLVEIDATNFPGLYSLDLTATEVDTLGYTLARVKPTGALEARAAAVVVPYDPFNVDKSGFGLSSAERTAIQNLVLTDATPFPGADIALIQAKTTNLPASPAAVSDIPTAAAVTTAILDTADTIETGLTVRNALRLSLAALAGQASGLATTTAIFKSAVSALKNRITATVDANGNRTSITTDLT